MRLASNLKEFNQGFFLACLDLLVLFGIWILVSGNIWGFIFLHGFFR